MTQAATQKLDIHLSNYRQAAEDLPGHATGWVRDLRQRAIETYEALGWPTTKQEAWKYTSLREVEKIDFRPPADAEGSDVSASDLAPYTFEAGDTVEVVFVNGRFREDLSDLTLLPDGVTVADLATVLDEQPDRVKAHLAQHAELEDEPFTALNTASFEDGIYVEIPEGTTSKVPIHVLYVTALGGTPLITHPRTLVVAGDNAEATVVETFATLGEGPALTNHVLELVTGRNATLYHTKLNRESLEGYHIGTEQGHQARDSVLRSHMLTFGGKIVRNNVYNRIDGTGCDAILNGLYLGEDDQHIDNYTVIEHAAAHGQSHQLYKGILDDESQGTFRGTIYVAKGAQKTDAYQHNPNLLLSRDSLANSVPQLEIFADDVKCSHGSTTGQLDDKWIFYLRSRGVSEAAARDLLTYAFAGEVIEMIQVEAVRETVKDLVLERLEQGEAVSSAL